MSSTGFGQGWNAKKALKLAIGQGAILVAVQLLLVPHGHWTRAQIVVLVSCVVTYIVASFFVRHYLGRRFERKQTNRNRN